MISIEPAESDIADVPSNINFSLVEIGRVKVVFDSHFLNSFTLMRLAIMSQQEIEVEVIDGSGRPQKAILTVENDPAVKRFIWSVVTLGIPFALFRSQGQSHWDYMARPRYVRALEIKEGDILEIVEGEKLKFVSMSRKNERVLLHYFQNPIPGNVWAVKDCEGEYLLRQLDGLQVALCWKAAWSWLGWLQVLLNAHHSITDIRARTVPADRTQTPEWKSLLNGDIAQIYRPEASFAYHTESEDLPRIEVEPYPEVFVRVDGYRVPMRMLSITSNCVTVVTEAGFQELKDGSKGTTCYTIDPFIVRLTTRNYYGKGEVSTEGLGILSPFNSGYIASLPSPHKARGCSGDLVLLAQ